MNSVESILKNEIDYPSEKKEDHILDIYKLYVDMTDKLSNRRHLTNTWFLTLNTTIMTIAGFLLSKNLETIMLIIILLAGFVNCILWNRLIASYKRLNTARFKVIQEIEEQLPIKTFCKEWDLLNNDRNSKQFYSLTKIENKIPLIFALLYIIIGLFQFLNLEIAL